MCRGVQSCVEVLRVLCRAVQKCVEVFRDL